VVYRPRLARDLRIQAIRKDHRGRGDSNDCREAGGGVRDSAVCRESAKIERLARGVDPAMCRCRPAIRIQPGARCGGCPRSAGLPDLRPARVRLAPAGLPITASHAPSFSLLGRACALIEARPGPGGHERPGSVGVATAHQAPDRTSDPQVLACLRVATRRTAPE
jgi:hypothetical protein